MSALKSLLNAPTLDKLSATKCITSHCSSDYNPLLASRSFSIKAAISQLWPIGPILTGSFLLSSLLFPAPQLQAAQAIPHTSHRPCILLLRRLPEMPVPPSLLNVHAFLQMGLLFPWRYFRFHLFIVFIIFLFPLY